MFGNVMVSFNICSISIILSDERSSFDLKYDDDDDVRHHWLKNDGVTVNDAAPCSLATQMKSALSAHQIFF